jgi:hypothetical protein
MPEIQRGDFVSIRPNIREVVTSLHCACSYVTGEE